MLGATWKYGSGPKRLSKWQEIRVLSPFLASPRGVAPRATFLEVWQRSEKGIGMVQNERSDSPSGPGARSSNITVEFAMAVSKVMSNTERGRPLEHLSRQK